MKKVICLVLSLFLLVLPVSTVSASVNNDKNVNTGAAYYVDSVSGDDSNDGKTTKTAWKSLDKVNSIEFKPGDKVLFKAGGMWTGQLRPHGSGVEGKPIIMDMYGTGNKPIINGAGIIDKEETYAGNHASTTFMLNEEEYWEINNLEITNSGNEREGDDFRRGVYITAYNSGVRNHIYLRNLYVHDVFGHYTGTYADSNHQTYKNMGGILFKQLDQLQR